MDWKKYPTIDSYVSRLADTSYQSEDPFVSTLPFGQCIVYDDKPNPIQTVERMHLEFYAKKRDGSDIAHTFSLWSIVASLIDDIHLLGNPSMKKINVQFLSQSLKEYIIDKSIYSLLTARRVYPLLELLDKPRVPFEKKHQNALGYFLSFLLHKQVTVLGEVYNWSRDCEESTIRLVKNMEGFWSLEKEKKIDNV